MTLLLSATVKVSVLVLVALTLATLLRKRSAAVRHWVLATAFVCCLTVPALELLLPSWSVPLTLPASWSASSTSSSLRFTSESNGGGRTLPGNSVSSTTAPSPRRNAAETSARAILAVWIIGLAAGLGTLAAGVVRIRRLASRAEPEPSGRWRAVAEELSRTYELRRHVRLLLCAHPTMLVTWGTLTPTILLPAGAQDWPEDRIRVVLHHELGHIRRGDWILTLGATLTRCIYWFNPLLWIACRRLRQESERACDDLVLTSGVSGTDYATHLLDVARESAQHRHAWSPAIAMAHQSTLEGRVRAMLNARVNREPLTGLVRAVTLTVVVAATLSIAVVSLSGNATAGAATPRADIALTPPESLPVRPAGDRVGKTAPARAVAAPSRSAQAAAATIEGVLYDQFGGLLPGVAVTLTHAGSGGRYDVSTDPSGAFAFRALPLGDYVLTTQLPGFAPVTNMVRVAAGETVRRQITLPIGSVTETISVTCEGRSFNAAPRMGAPRPRRVLAATVPNLFSGGIGGQIKAPNKVLHVSPVCPTGNPVAPSVVVLVGRIGIDGFLSDLRDTSAESQPALLASALEAVRQWEFTPTLLNGVPVEVNITTTVQYSWPR